MRAPEWELFIYSRSTPREKWPKEDDVCAPYVCTLYVCTRIMLRFLLYSAYPGEWKTNVFEPAPFVPRRCVRAARGQTRGI